MRLRSLAPPLALAAALCLPAHAQSLDLAAGLSAVSHLPASNGAWINLGATAMPWSHLGVAGNFFARPANSQDPFFASNFHAFFLDVDAVWRPLPQARIVPELELGGGSELRHYAGGFACAVGTIGACPTPSTVERALHFGLSAQTYFAPRWFLRAAFDTYLVHNLDEPALFSLGLGYTFGRR